MLVLSAITWFVLPSFSKLPPGITVDTQAGPGKIAAVIANWFKAFWVVCGIVAIGLCVMTRMGVLDPLLPALNLLLVVAAVAVVGLCLFCYYAPLASLELPSK